MGDDCPDKYSITAVVKEVFPLYPTSTEAGLLFHRCFLVNLPPKAWKRERTDRKRRTNKEEAQPDQPMRSSSSTLR